MRSFPVATYAVDVHMTENHPGCHLPKGDASGGGGAMHIIGQLNGPERQPLRLGRFHSFVIDAFSIASSTGPYDTFSGRTLLALRWGNRA